MNPDQRGSRKILSAALLSLTGGYLDAYSYYTRDGVFANAQTGNIIRASLAIAEARFYDFLHYLIPVLAFVTGVFLSMSIERWFEKHWHAYPRRAVLCIEILLLVIISFLPQTRAGNMTATTMISLLCAMQMQTFRVFGRQTMTTTVATGNLRQAVENLYHGLMQKDKAKIRTAVKFFSVIFLFVLGVILGARITMRSGIRSALVPAGLLAMDFLYISLVYARVQKEQNNNTRK